MMDCKAALTEANGDMDEAITILRKKGMAQVAKKAGRAMKEGLVGVRLNADATDGVVAEVNCETDFVARTADFQALVDRRHRRPARRAGDRGDRGARSRRRRRSARRSPPTIAKTGENMAVTRAVRYAGEGYVGSYLHMGGKIGVLVELQGVPAAARASDAVADAGERDGDADRRGEPVLRHARGSAGRRSSSRRRTSTARRWRTAASRPT